MQYGYLWSHPRLPIKVQNQPIPLTHFIAEKIKPYSNLYKILLQKAEYKRHGNDEACKLDICGLV